MDATVTTSTVVAEVALTTVAAEAEVDFIEEVTTVAPSPTPQEQVVLSPTTGASEPLPPTAGATMYATTLAVIAGTVTLLVSA